MADPAVKMQFFGNSADAERALVKLEQKFDKLQNKMKHTGASSRRATGSVVAGFVKAQLSVAAFTGFLRSALQYQRQLRLEAENTAIALDKSARKLQIQAGLTDLQRGAAKGRVAEIAKASGVDAVTINRIATEAVSQGFKGDPLAKSGATEQILAFLQSTGRTAAGEPIEELVAGIATILTAQSKKLTAVNLLPALLQTRGLFAETPLQAPDLTDFSKAAKALSVAGLDQEQILVASAVSKLSFPQAPEASTALRKTVTRMVAPSPSATRALTALDLKPEDVDLVGESFPAALKRLGAALDALPQEKRLPILKDIFGDKVLIGAIGLIQSAQQGKFEEFTELARDREGFEAGVRVARSGLAASVGKGAARLSDAQRRMVESGGVTIKEARQQLATQEALDRIQLTPAQIKAGQLKRPPDMVSEWMKRGLAEIGGMMGRPDVPGVIDAEQIRTQRQSTFKLEELLQEQVDLQKKIVDNTTVPAQRPNRNANGE